MRSNRRRNWFIKRVALGLAIAAVAAPVAQARVDEGSSVQSNRVNASVKPIPYRWPSSADDRSWTDPGIVWTASGYRPFVSDFPHSNPDQIEVVRAQPRATPSDKIEFVRTQPRSIGEPQVVAAGFDWKDAGIGAGLVLALVLLGGGAALVSRRIGHAQTA